MAKGVGLIGNMSGKLGNTIGYQIKNSNNKVTQGFRVYQPRITNPQTDIQLDQRVKMAVVVNEYRALRDIISRGQEAFEYGDASRRAWLSVALGSAFQGPYLLKGEKSPLPMPNVPIAVGGLPEVVISEVNDDGHALTSLLAPNSLGTNIGTLSAALLDNNPWLEAGDQLTFVLLLPATQGVTGEVAYYYQVSSLYLDRTSTASVLDLSLSVGVEPSVSRFYFSDDGESAVAAALIVSRDGPADKHERSTAKFGLSDDLALYYANLSPAAARRSYKKNASAGQDWQIQPSADGGSSSAVTAKLKDGTEVTVSSLSSSGGYMLAGSYYVQFTGKKDTKYEKYLSSYNSATATAPSAATDENTIGIDIQATDATSRAFLSWLIYQGVDAQWLYTGS